MFSSKEIQRKRGHMLLTAMALAVSAASNNALADPGGSGKLIFLGRTADLQHSLFLSVVSPGVYDVRYPQTGQVFSEWTQTRKGLHLTVSTEVTEYGGTHNMFTHITDQYSSYQNFVDSADQVPGRFTFPNKFPTPSFPVRPTEPSVPSNPEPITPTMPTLPPTGLTPTVPTLPPTGLTPTVPTLPPTGLTPTVPTLPPTGLTPTVPTLPPTGLTPTVPTLPPTGLTPTVPTAPPTGLMPTRPGPIRPPTGEMPTRPGAVTPPIATLPPFGLTPTMPTRPPSSVLPTLPPTGLTPTVPTLPPSGVLPDRPEGVQPPVAILPPSSRPGVPDIDLPSTQLPGGTLARTDAGAIAADNVLNTQLPCGVYRQDQLQSNPSIDLPEGCNPNQQAPLAVASAGTSAVAERAVQAGTGWSTWADESYSDITDKRNNADLEGYSNALTVGTDKRLDNGLIVGFMYGRQNSRSDMFNGAMKYKSSGYSVGPYVAYQYSERWMIDGTVSYGRTNNQQDLLMLSGDYDSQSIGAGIGATGQYLWKDTLIRPRVAVNYTHYSSDDFRMSGAVSGLQIGMDMPDDSYNYGSLTTSTEFSRVYFTRGGRPLMPYIDLSLDYAFERPNDGDMLSGDLTQAGTEPLTGAVRVGIRSLLSPTTTLTASGGYTSIGQNGLDVQEWRINLSHSF